MPPLEAIMGLISLLISWSRGQSSAGGSAQSTGGSAQRVGGSAQCAGGSAQPCKLATLDISRAHFHGKARRRVFVEFETEDCAEYGEDERGLLLNSMDGTQDASQI
eukprot:9297839-Heterocapsa_arctica.AAC.1